MEKKLKVGRPTAMTESILGKLEEVFAIGGTDSEACFYADISPDTLYSYQLKNPEFTERKEALKNKPILLARQEVVKGIKGNPNFALSYLERKLKGEFSTRQEVESSVRLIDSTVKIALIEKLTNRDDKPKGLIAGKPSKKRVRRHKAVQKVKA